MIKFVCFGFGCYRSSFREGRAEIIIAGLTTPHSYACPKPEQGFSSNLLSFFLFELKVDRELVRAAVLGNRVDHYYLK